MSSHFLWPKGSIIRTVFSAYRLTSISTIEEKLRCLFPSGYPVLCTSGRSALFLALSESGVTRKDFVGVFPYASHCVLNTIARLATPLSEPTHTVPNLRVVFHQWGYRQEILVPPNTIEDCVDTLCVPGANLFPSGGRFEIWSLPKILGTTSGGVLWCRDEHTAKKLRKVQLNRPSGFSHGMLRLIGRRFKKAYVYWHGAECILGRLTKFQLGEIVVAINKWDRFVEDREKKLNMVWPFVVDGITKPTERLPSVVPINSKLSDGEVHLMGISSGYRMFEEFKGDGSRQLLSVLPVPIHQDVSEHWLDNFVNSGAVKTKEVR